MPYESKEGKAHEAVHLAFYVNPEGADDNCDLFKGPTPGTIFQAYREKGLLVDVTGLRCIPEAPKQFTCTYVLHRKTADGQTTMQDVTERYHHANDKWQVADRP